MTDSEKIRRAVQEDVYVGNVAPLLAVEVRKLVAEVVELTAERDRWRHEVELLRSDLASRLVPATVLLPSYTDPFQLRLCVERGVEIKRLKEDRRRLIFACISIYRGNASLEDALAGIVAVMDCDIQASPLAGVMPDIDWALAERDKGANR